MKGGRPIEERRGGDLTQGGKDKEGDPNLLPFLSSMWSNNGACLVSSLMVIWSSKCESACFYY